MSGVYIIINKINKKIYIGASINICYRFKQHKDALKYSYHINTDLQADYDKYGYKNFIFDILDISSEQEMYALEILFIKEFLSNNKEYGYNKTRGGQGGRCNYNTRRKISNTLKGHAVSIETRRKIGKNSKQRTQGKDNPFYGRKHTAETKKHLSEINKGRKPSVHTRNKMSLSYDRSLRVRKIVQYDMYNNTIKIWDAIIDASRCLGIERRNINACCKNKRRSAGGYKWKYYGEEIYE